MNDPTGWLQRHADWPLVFDFFSDVAGPVGWWALLQIFVLLLGTQRGLRLVWLVAITAYANTLLKWAWAEPRPYWTTDSIQSIRAAVGFGMPSGHAQGAMALWLGVWLILRNHSRSLWLLAVLLVFIVFTGLSRIYYGVHSVAQVAVGFALGAAVTLLLWWLLPRLEAWLGNAALRVRIAFAVGAVAVAGLVGLMTYALRADFVAPADWVSRFIATQARTGQTGEMGLVNAQALILVVFIAGYAVLALVACEQGHRIAASARARVLCVLCAIVINGAALAGLQMVGASGPLVALWLLLQPLAALWLPLRLFGEPVQPELPQQASS